MAAVLKSYFYLMLTTIFIVLCSGALSYMVYKRSEATIKESINRQKAYLEYQNNIVARDVEQNFSQIYHGIRSISKLPSIRTINRHATNLNQNDIITIQELYNNLASSAKMSEVYIISSSFDPKKFDTYTQKLEEPNIMFDQLIVGRSADSYLQKEEGSEEENLGSGLEEIETYEYNLIHKQIAWFKQHYPSLDNINGLNVPAISGEEVITCDNSRYSGKNPRDKDRSGFVYSIPFYGFDGNLDGVVSAIFLSHTIRDMFPSGHYVLINKKYNYFIYPYHPDKQLTDSRASIENIVPDPNLILSLTTPLEIVDADSEWVLWAGFPDTIFTKDINTIKNDMYLKQFSILSFMCIGFFVLFRLDRGIKQEKEILTHLKEEAEEASQIKSRFLANMSHEIRTPMNGVIGMLELLMNTTLDTKQDKYATTAYRCGQELLALVNDILDFSKIEAGEMVINFEVFDLDTLMQHLVETYKPLAEKKNIKLNLKIETSGSGRLLGDALRIRQVLTNLVGNAIKFTHEGSVTIKVYMKKLQHGVAEVCFEVEDTGIGIPQNKQHLLFNKFSQVDITTTKKYGGTGLGLAISKSLVEMMGGKIGIKTQETGSTFWFTLPMEYAN